jgi:ribonuclease P protein component
VLPAANRLRRSADFATVVRRGARARSGALVVHHRSLRPGPATVGLVVGRSVGNSVVRHRVARRLRAQLAARLHRLPEGTGTVVRALPAAADAPSARLGADLDAALRRLLGAATSPTSPGSRP